jgi:WhiB family redox-sensing transcriptional regulator
MATSGPPALLLGDNNVTRYTGECNEAAGNPAVFLLFGHQPENRRTATPDATHYSHSQTNSEGDEVMGLLVNTLTETRAEAQMDTFTHSTDWEAYAACRAVENAADLFFSEDIGEIAAAKRVCAECPVLAQCLEGALDRREPVGVWGGQLFMNGKMLAIKRRRGRPPKVARPEDQMPVIPVPAHLMAQAERLTA